MDGSRSDLSHEQRRQLVIVALPAEDDPVQKYSSEKEPHLTLLYLGEPDFNATDMQHVVEYVEHAASMLPRFGLNVDRRGELGDQRADVLFFDKKWSKDVAKFRGHLLQDDLINAAYRSADQYPDWTPHLTMGYPDAPAKKDDREYAKFTWVWFDRIAIWVEDYIGPTFQLKDEYENMEVAMTELKRGETLEEVLAHYGVKGMKWGVRGGAARAARKAATPSADAKRVGEIHKTVKGIKTTKTLSNAELQDAINRMNLEKQYSQLSGGLDKTRVQKSRRFIAQILGAAGKQTVQQVANNELKTRVDQTINNARK